ncbi:MAG TPA: thioredoxin family protein [Caulobacteraceae bacterium]|nr:thioredoxin family protein [Caulobacteraceae bacterium]
MTLVALTLALAFAGAGRAAPVRAQHLSAELVAETTGAAPGSTVWVALSQDIDKGWHTYWRNPGDAGEATKIGWTLPAGWRAGDIVWPAPGRFLLGKPPNALMNYVYEGKVLLPVPIEVPASARPGETYVLKGAAAFLVCADVCVPADAQLELRLPIVAGTPAPDPRWGPAIAKTLAEIPKPAGLTAAFQTTPGGLKLAIAGAPLKGVSGADAYFYPYDDKFIDHSKPQAVERGAGGLTLTLAPGYAFTHGAAPAEATGVLTADGKAYEVTARAGPPPAGAAGLGAPAKAPRGLGVPLALAFAFLGGLILNLMPCVFPILSMKAAAFAGHAHEARAARAQGLAFLAGVLVTFLGLAGVLIAARAGGEAVGWGFQLQSPMIVAALTLVILLAALNLSGLYELGTSVQGAGASLASRGGLIGAAFTGALAVIVAAPCTAPFMAPALGYALTQPPAVALAVFLALALGFAAPFTALSFAPALIRRFPKPGPWMDVLRKVLAFPMYGAAAWLAWVLERQAGSDGLARILAAAVALALGAWLLGLSQRRMTRGNSNILLRTLALLIVGVAAALALAAPYAPARPGAAPLASAVEIPQLPYSPERLAELRAAGKPVFVNFTAAWCVTCQVNDKSVLQSREVAAAFKRAGAVYLLGDWTNRNAMIAQALAEQGRVGVPLYLVYGADGGPPKVLPQLLSTGVVVEALDGAKARPHG